MSYCEFVSQSQSKYAELHRHYHDKFYGFPVASDEALFERLVLEINQAGLNWGIILARQEAFRQALASYDIARVAAYGEEDLELLLGNADIIRNRLKIQACIYNAQQILSLQQEHGSFKNWLDQQAPLSLEEWVKRFKKVFKFVGPEIVKEMLMSTGYLPGAHDPSCPVYQRILQWQPPWLKHQEFYESLDSEKE